MMRFTVLTQATNADMEIIILQQNSATNWRAEQRVIQYLLLIFAALFDSEV